MLFRSTGLATGEYKGAITVTSGALTSKVNVELNVGPGQAPKLVIAPKVFNFFSSKDDKNSNTRMLQVINAGGGTLTWAAKATVNTPTGGTWLSISPTSGSSATGAPSDNRVGQITIKVDPGTLAAGEYSGKVTVTAGTDSQDAMVYLKVSGPSVVIRPKELKFTATGGVPSPASRDITIKIGRASCRERV